MNIWGFGGPILADWATSLWNDLDGNQRFVILIVSIGCATGIICTIIALVSNTIKSVHGRRIDAEMKRDMLDRGMSADEISKIIEAVAPPEDATQRLIASWAKKKP